MADNDQNIDELTQEQKVLILQLFKNGVYKNNNNVTIVGVLNEIDVEEREKDGRKYVSGTIKIQTGEDNVIPVNVFSFEKTKKNTANPSYTQIMSVCEKGVSMAAVNGDMTKATKVRASGIRIEENMYVSRFSNQVVSTIRLNGSFFTLNAADDSKAHFNCGIYISGIKEEVTSDGEETGRLIIEGLVEQYNRWDKLTFIAESKQAVEYIQSNWAVGDTVSVSGKIVDKTITQKVSTESAGGFGEPEEEIRTYHRIEYVITSGSEPKEEEFAYDGDRVKEGISDRERRRAELLEGNKSKPVAAKSNDDDLDF